MNSRADLPTNSPTNDSNNNCTNWIWMSKKVLDTLGLPALQLCPHNSIFGCSTFLQSLHTVESLNSTVVFRFKHVQFKEVFLI